MEKAASLHMNRRHRGLALSIFIISIAAFFLVKFGGNFMVRYLFENDQISTLKNILSVSDEPHSLTYYLGFAERNLLGPISQVLAFLAFLSFALHSLQYSSMKVFGLGVFLFLMISKIEVLFFPPYGDAIGGPFSEAWWLAKNNFNYIGLAGQPDYAQGGPRVYLFSIYPTYVALWMKIFRNPSVYLPLMHVVVFAAISTVVSMFREICRKIFSEKTAILTAVLFLSLSLVQSQTESLNMEASCLFFIMSSAFFLTNRKIFRAALAALGAVLIKGTGIMACGAVAITASVMFISDFRSEKKMKFKYISCIIFMVAVAVLKLCSKYLINDAHVSAGMVGFFNGWPSLKTITIVRWFLAGTIVYLAVAIFRFNRVKGKFFEMNVMYLYGAVFFGMMLNFFVVSPRYTVNVYPFVLFSVVCAATLIVESQRWQMVLLSTAIFIAAFSSYGYMGGQLYDHVILERSLEYRNDLHLDREIVRTIEDEFANYKIGAPIQITQMLAIKEMGYVKKDLDVFIYGFPCRYGGVGSFSGLKNLDITKTIFIGKKSDQSRKEALVPEYPVDPNDLVLKKLQYGGKEAWIFMGGLAIEKLHRKIQHILYFKRHRQGDQLRRK